MGVYPEDINGGNIHTICKKCGAQIDDKSVFCIHCGTKVEAEKPLKAEDSANQGISAEALKCRKCGNSLPAGTKFCPNCGTKTGALKKQGDVYKRQYDES